jgi:ankyrin repeat protein
LKARARSLETGDCWKAIGEVVEQKSKDWCWRVMMNLRQRTTAVVFLFISLCLAGAIRASAQQVTRNDEWVFTTGYGVPVWIALNELPATAVKNRNILIYIEPQHFTPENIKKLFTNLAAKYKEPDWLNVTAFSDKPMLQRAIANATSGFAIDWANTPEGKAAAKKWAQEHDPLPSGYYRAHYSRIARFYRVPHKGFVPWYVDESYSYSPDAAKPEMMTLILQSKPSGPPYSGALDIDLLIAAHEGAVEKVQSLLKQGAKVDSRNEAGDTPLMIAALKGQSLQIVNALLAKGADVNAQNKEKDTALIYAASNQEADILQALLAKGAAINQQNDNRYSALIMAAAVEYRLACLKALLARGADVEVKDDDGDTPLIKAADHKTADMVKALLAKGANVNAQGQNDETALMRARDKATALILLSHGAEVNAKDEEGTTALMIAAQRGDVDKAQALLEHGADIKAKNNQGETALIIANKGYGRSNAILDLLESAEAKQASAATPEDEARTGGRTNSLPELMIKRDPKAQCCEETSSVTFSPDGKVIAAKLYHSSFAGNHGIIFWDMSNGKLIRSIEGPPNGAFAIKYNVDGRAVSSEYGKTWDVETGKLIRPPGTSGDTPDETTVYSATFSADGKISAAAEKKIGGRNYIAIREATTGQLLRAVTTDTTVTQLKLSADGKSLVGVIRAMNTVAIWDTSTGEVTQKMKVIGPGFTDLTISNDGRMVAASASDLRTREEATTVFDASTGKVIHNLNGYGSVVFSLAFSADGRLLASGSG